MKLLIINVVCGTGSTGKICSKIAQEYKDKGYEVKIAFGREELVPEKYRNDTVVIGNKAEVKAHALYTRLTDRHGFGSKKATKKFLEWAESYDPDVIWLHNVHGYYINIEMLFNWLKHRNCVKPETEIKWTLHDCWTMTGHCAFFTAAKCDKWKSKEGCHDCPQIKDYPASYVDGSRKNFAAKKRIFTGVKNLTLITPSKWLANLTRESFLSEYPVEVSYNTVDPAMFRKMDAGDEYLKEIREKYSLGDKPFILGISNVWDRRKGLEDLLKLAYLARGEYATVIIGLREKQIKSLPELTVKCMAEVKDMKETPLDGSEIETKYGLAVPEGVGYLYEGLKNLTRTNKAEIDKDTDGSGKETEDSRDGEVAKKNESLEGVASAVEKETTEDTEPPKKPRRPRIIPILHTANQEELAAFYNMAEVLVNPTHEDNYPTVNLEAISCGTKVLTYNVGGSAETLEEKEQ